MEVEILEKPQVIKCNNVEYSGMGQLLEEIKTAKPTERTYWGPRAWKALDTICEYIPCQTCSDHCHDMIRFEHDVVNAFKDKSLYQPKETKKYLYSVNQLLGKKMQE